MIHWMRQVMICLILCGAHVSSDASACGKQGVCDLTASELDWSKGIPITGEWQFYWKQLLTPKDLQEGKGQLTAYLPPDVDWRATNIPEIQDYLEPFATYHIEFRSSSTEPLTIKFPRLPSAARLWINDQMISSMGQLSVQGKELSARQRMTLHTFVPRPGSNSITIELSNFSYFYHGGVGGVLVGRPDVIHQEHRNLQTRDALTFGAISIMAFYHFYLWWIRRSRLSPLYFGVFCLAMGTRSIVIGYGQIFTTVFPEAPLELQLKLEYLSIAVPFLAIVLLVHDLYPKELPKLLTKSFAALAGLWVFLIALTPASMYPQSLRIYQLFLVIAGFSMIAALILAAVRKREGALIFLMGFGSLFSAGLIDILVNMGVLQLPPVAHIGTFAMIFFQAILLSRRFDQAFDQAEQAEKEVRFLNEGLELMVKARTDQINTILKNVSSGFLVIDQKGVLQPGFTESCRRLIGVDLKPGMKLSEILPLDDQTKAILKATISQVFQDMLPLEVSLEQIPHSLAINGRTLGVSGAGLRNDAGELWAILFTMNDVTRLQEAEKRVRYNEMLLGILREKAAFKVFLADFRHEIQLAFSALQSQDSIGIRNLLHTMKGNLSIFGMQQAADYIHQVEGLNTIDVEHIEHLSDLVEILLEDNKDLLGLDNKELVFELRSSDYHEIVTWSAQQLNPRHHQELLKMLKRCEQNPIRNHIGPLQSTVEKLGKKLDKNVVCDITGTDILVDERYASVLKNLIHLIRNAVDHGIELPEDRGSKDPTGKIQVAFTQTPSQLLIRVQDDGRGIDPEIVKNKAKSLGLFTGDGAQLSEAEIYRFIFAPGFSTATELSDISGRGVGMGAILQSVEELGGQIHISSEQGHGVKVEIDIPLADPETSSQPLDVAV
jgi:signal transduction histidine kinase